MFRQVRTLAVLGGLSSTGCMCIRPTFLPDGLGRRTICAKSELTIVVSAR